MERKYQIDTAQNSDFLKKARNELLSFGHKFPSPKGSSYYLGDDGTPWKTQNRETWITSRMAHVYCLGSFLSHPGSKELASAAIKGLCGELHDDKNGGWYAGLTADGSILPNKQCYAHAFVILAASSGVLAGIDQADALLAKGSRVLYLPEETKESLKGFYCTEFWCYPMFRDICEWMKKPVAVGTMGLLIQNEHAALKQFPSHSYATPQWYQLVSHCDCAILDDTTDKSFRPIVQMIDNFDRNHKLGILFEGQVGNGSLMVCTIRLSELVNLTEPTRDESITATDEVITYRDVTKLPEVDQFIRSIISYVSSDAFKPSQTLDMKKLRKTFIGE